MPCGKGHRWVTTVGASEIEDVVSSKGWVRSSTMNLQT